MGILRMQNDQLAAHFGLHIGKERDHEVAKHLQTTS
jgi:hypothetical protein